MKGKLIYLKINGKYFVFDKESKDEFDKFNDDLFRVTVYNGYLARHLKCQDESKVTFFHEWFMREEIEKFREEHDYWKAGKVHVHHTTYCKRINIKRYLGIFTEDEHEKFHGGYAGIKWIYDDEDWEKDLNSIGEDDENGNGI